MKKMGRKKYELKDQTSNSWALEGTTSRSICSEKSNFAAPSYTVTVK